MAQKWYYGDWEPTALLGSKVPIFPLHPYEVGISGYYDPVVNVVQGIHFSTEMYSLDKACRVILDSPTEVAIPFLGASPMAASYGLWHDISRFGNIFTNFQWFLKSMRTMGVNAMKPPKEEHEVAHFNRTGVVRVPSVELVKKHTPANTLSADGVTYYVPINRNGLRILSRNALGQYGTGPASPYVWVNFEPEGCLNPLKTSLKTQNMFRRFLSHSQWKELWIEDYTSNIISPTEFTVSYKLCRKHWNGNMHYTTGYWVRWDLVKEFHCFLTEPSPGTIARSHVGNTTLVGPFASVTYKYTPYLHSWGPNVYPSQYWFTAPATSGTVVSSEVFLNSNIANPVTTYDHDSVFSDRRRWAIDNRRTTVHWNQMAAAEKDLRPAVFYSTKDAIDSHMEVLKTNHMETLSDLRELGSLLPDKGPLVNLLADTKVGKLIDMGVHLVDFLTSAKLWHDFVLRPTVGSTQEFVQKLDTILDRLRGLGSFGTKTLNGKFVYTLPQGEFGLVNPILTARSKVRLTFPNTSIMSIIMGSNALGLTPKLSSFWDLIPLSFVADWFANIGSRLEAIESQLMLMMLEIVFCTHSITVAGELPLDYYQELEAGPGNDPARLVFYRRYTSIIAPSLRSSKYDFLAASGPQDWGTFGSLVWQII